MPIGPLVRRALGPFEHAAAERFRSIFFNLDRFIDDVAETVPAARILEVGCGEGAVCRRLADAYPEAEIVGIDITPRLGRLFQGDRTRVTFRRCYVQELAADGPEPFDLVVVADVLHHVPWQFHAEFLHSARRLLKPGGWLVVKDWERRFTPIHWAAYFIDRVITGDRISYGTSEDFRSRIAENVGVAVDEPPRRYPPWRNNMAFFVQVG